MNTTSNDPTKMPATIPNKPHNNTFSELFFILIAMFIPHCPHKPASEKTDGKDVSKREAGANEPPDKPS